MRFNYLVIAFVLLPLVVIGQQKELSGSVTSSKSKTPLPFVHLYNQTAKIGASTSETGTFTLRAQPGDSIIVSSIGYERLYHHVTSDDFAGELRLIMTEKPMELAPVEIFAYKDVKALKEAIVENDLPLEQKPVLFGMPPAGSDYGKLTVPERVEAPITENLVGTVGLKFSASAGSGDGKAAKELKELEAKKTIAAKYNPDWIKNVTGLKEADIDAFMRFCALKDNFILEATEYELTVAVLTCLDDFEEQRH